MPFQSSISELAECAREDPTAFGIIYNRYIDRIYRYIYTQVHNIQANVPPENVIAMFDAAHEFGEY